MTGPRLSRINRRPEEQRETQKYDDAKNEKNVLKIHQLKNNKINLTVFCRLFGNPQKTHWSRQTQGAGSTLSPTKPFPRAHTDL